MNKQEIRDLMRFFDKSDISRVKIKNGDFSIELEKGYKAYEPIVPDSKIVKDVEIVQEGIVSADKVESIESVSSSLDYIKSPMVGTFYVAPSPGAEPFVKVGDIVRKGQSVAIIEAMKIMNEIEAEFDCKIVEALVEDGEPVEFDMPLFGVEKI